MRLIEELTREQIDDLLKFLLKTNIQNSVCLVNHQALQIFVQKLRSSLKMVQESARSCHNNVYT